MPVATISPFSRERRPAGVSPTASGYRRQSSASVESHVSASKEADRSRASLPSSCSFSLERDDESPASTRRRLPLGPTTPESPASVSVSLSPTQGQQRAVKARRISASLRTEEDEEKRSSRDMPWHLSKRHRDAWAASRKQTRRRSIDAASRASSSWQSSASSLAVVPLSSGKDAKREGMRGDLLIALRGTVLHPISLLAFHGVRLKHQALVSLNLVEACAILGRLQAESERAGDRETRRHHVTGDLANSPSLFLLFCLLSTIAQVHLRQIQLLLRDLKLLRLKVQNAEAPDHELHKDDPSFASSPLPSSSLSSPRLLSRRIYSSRPSSLSAASASRHPCPWELRPRVPVGQGMLSVELYYEALAAGPGKASTFRRRKRKKTANAPPTSKDDRTDAWAVALLPEDAADNSAVSFLDPKTDGSAFFFESQAPLKADDADTSDQSFLEETPFNFSASAFPFFDNCGDLVALSRDSAAYMSLRRSSTSSSLSLADSRSEEGRTLFGHNAFSLLRDPRSAPLEDPAVDTPEHASTTSSAFPVPASGLFRRPETQISTPLRGDGFSANHSELWNAAPRDFPVEDFPEEEVPIGVAVDPRVASPIRVGGVYGQRESEGSRQSELSSHLSSLSRPSSGKGTPDRLGDFQAWRGWADGDSAGDPQSGDRRRVSLFDIRASSAFLRHDDGEDPETQRDDLLLNDPFFDDNEFFLPHDASRGEVGEQAFSTRSRETRAETGTETRASGDSPVLALPWEETDGGEQREAREGGDGRKRLKGEKQSLRFTWDGNEERLARIAWGSRGTGEADLKTLGEKLLNAAAGQAKRILEEAEERERVLLLHARNEALHSRQWSAPCCSPHLEEELKKRRSETERAEQLATTHAGDASATKTRKKGKDAGENDCVLDPRDGGLHGGDQLLQRHLFNSMWSRARMSREDVACMQARRETPTLSWEVAKWQTRAQRAGAAAANSWTSADTLSSAGCVGEERRSGESQRSFLDLRTRVSPRASRVLASLADAERRRETGRDAEDRDERDGRAAKEDEDGESRGRRDAASTKLGATGHPELREEDSFSDAFLGNEFFEASPDGAAHMSLSDVSRADDRLASSTQGEREETALALQHTEEENEIGPSAWRLLATVNHLADAAASSRLRSSASRSRLLGLGSEKECHVSSEEGSPPVPLQSVIAGHSRMTAARAFRDALLLHAKGFIDLEQSSEFQTLPGDAEGRHVFAPVYIQLKPQRGEKTARSPSLGPSSPGRGVPPSSVDFAPDLGEKSSRAGVFASSSAAANIRVKAENVRKDVHAVKEEWEPREASASRGGRLSRFREAGEDANPHRQSSAVRGEEQDVREDAGEASWPLPEFRRKNASERKERRERERDSRGSSKHVANPLSGKPGVRLEDSGASRARVKAPRELSVKREEEKRQLTKQERVRQSQLAGPDGDIVVEIEDEDLETCISASLERRRRQVRRTHSRSPSVASIPRGDASKRHPLRPFSFSSSFLSSPSPCKSHVSTAHGQDRSPSGDSLRGEAESEPAAETTEFEPLQQRGGEREKDKEDENFVTDEQVEAAVEAMVAQLLHGLNEQDRIHSGHLVDWYIEEHVRPRPEEEAARSDSENTDNERQSRVPRSAAAVWRRRLHGALETLFAEEVICGEEIRQTVDEVPEQGDTNLPYRLYWLTGVAAIEALSQEEEG
ncbi:hypothetical protein TGDOM2_277260 [Toxoplasma gondii GAB2-2007-GAL-DOM2]|uniref:Uncharacterized protein n=5 Tax=Toxoplasma gondii TaxID=5811 RepID=S7UZL4_TOXGG|nr:hypothetical protein TGGT1_277260 [Toxoplasma gondii GT1]KAF4639010.1 hypothetical protein TGRH88_066190 [Toxoplasma gondii]KFG33224.1 hypothetical protein TGFOU_277260 [Toxoplasma gondii FOU]KFG34218.1 hypothetical protein TGDOM2_277260 [Toxoplasma gondii GAB2-2007-GAL-DOM2]RQX70273.1 hypothetical protein TGCAST_277260 [Toxoplasma gondii CAST]